MNAESPREITAIPVSPPILAFLAPWRSILPVDRLAEHVKERFARRRQPLLELGAAIAFTAGPGFLTRFVATARTGVGVLHVHHLEVLLPVRALFLQWGRAEAHLNPARRAVIAQSSVAHVAEVFSAGDRAAPERAVF